MMYQVCSPFMSTSKMKKIIALCALLALFAGCSKKELCVGDRVSKKVKQEKLEAVVLSIAEYDDYSNIIHKRTGSYKDTAGDSFSLEEKLKGKRAFKPVLSDLYDIYYEHDYDENGNLIHTFIHNTKDEDSLEYFFDYDESGKIVHCKNGSGDEHWYEYDERGNITHKKSYFYNDCVTVLTDLAYENRVKEQFPQALPYLNFSGSTVVAPSVQKLIDILNEA